MNNLSQEIRNTIYGIAKKQYEGIESENGITCIAEGMIAALSSSEIFELGGLKQSAHIENKEKLKLVEDFVATLPTNELRKMSFRDGAIWALTNNQVPSIQDRLYPVEELTYAFRAGVNRGGSNTFPTEEEYIEVASKSFYSKEDLNNAALLELEVIVASFPMTHISKYAILNQINFIKNGHTIEKQLE